MKNKYQIIKIILIAASLCVLIFGIMLLFFTYLREFIIALAEIIVVHRSLNHAHWHSELLNYGISFSIVSILLLCICLNNTLQKLTVGLIQKIYLKARKVYTEIRKIRIPRPIWLLVFLCVFLFIYVRLNINIIPVIALWLIYRLGFINWLIKIFGEKETKTALFITGIAIIFFIIVMSLFRVTIVMDFFFGTDQNRVFRDFTQVSANHYRAKVHPFYVLLWQSLYHLFCPLVNKTSLAIRILICIFSGLNCGIFSFFISRITKSKLLNIIICAIMVFSFPQISHGSQLLEAFIFTQSSIMLMLLYFSFAFSGRNYNLPALLALSLFVTGNNIAYLCIFAIFYIILLCQISESLRVAWNRALKFLIWYIIIFSLLLLTQTLFYGQSAPSNIFSIIRLILSEEGNYMSIHLISSQYVKKFFNVILFQQLPINIGPIFKHGWIWALLLLFPVFGFKKITNRPLFIAIAVSCVFLFLFHNFYGHNELALYSPVIMCVYMSAFAFITQILPKKITISLCCLLLAIMFCFNFTGLYTVHRINQYVFGSSDIVNDRNEYGTKINRANELIGNYKGNRIFLFCEFSYGTYDNNK